MDEDETLLASTSTSSILRWRPFDENRSEIIPGGQLWRNASSKLGGPALRRWLSARSPTSLLFHVNFFQRDHSARRKMIDHVSQLYKHYPNPLEHEIGISSLSLELLPQAICEMHVVHISHSTSRSLVDSITLRKHLKHKVVT